MWGGGGGSISSHFIIRFSFVYWIFSQCITFIEFFIVFLIKGCVDFLVVYAPQLCMAPLTLVVLTFHPWNGITSITGVVFACLCV